MNLNELRLTERFRAFISVEVASGRYADESEVVSAALRLLEKQTRDDEAKLARLRALVDVGIAELDRGEGLVIEGEEELREFFAGLSRQAAEKSRRQETA